MAICTPAVLTNCSVTVLAVAVHTDAKGKSVDVRFAVRSLSAQSRCAPSK